MSNEFIIKEEDGTYTIGKAVSGDEIIALARRIVEDNMRQPGVKINARDKAKDFLLLHLGRKEREIVTVFFLDSDLRLICFEDLFLGTISQSQIYPREISTRLRK